MKVILFGATGMVGQGVLRECLLDPEVERVLAVGRKATGQQHAKLRELVHKDFTDFSSVEEELTGYDACFFCLGVSSAGMKEEDYHRVTYDFTLAAAKTLVKRNPGMTFIYVSGTGTDSTEQGRSMWARVKGKTENALMKLPFKASFMFRPGIIQPMDGIKSQTKAYRVGYAVMAPLTPVLKALFPKLLTNTRQVGRAMLQAARHGAPKRLLENPDINSLAGGTS
ncbi:NAD-dependent epimerase/dehydratase family protein [Corallococcus sp. CA053C]|uniref:NAD(P)H-binding protein n=1 Tax=Corallococcus sp. CA053C TaxID=2316732 RepID=UPI000EA096B7|nr:NAD(P)H-binding protein [Corallococcus sp. CA053C]RKH13381.1 NAD-dependent epimerase/dehydratase family protein [Corallococcus sp. CA053C]